MEGQKLFVSHFDFDLLVDGDPPVVRPSRSGTLLRVVCHMVPLDDVTLAENHVPQQLEWHAHSDHYLFYVHISSIINRLSPVACQVDTPVEQ
jgi:hypothetical protein